MLGGLHREIAVLKLTVDWVEGSRWTRAMRQSNIASAGTANTFSKHHVLQEQDTLIKLP